MGNLTDNEAKAEFPISYKISFTTSRLKLFVVVVVAALVEDDIDVETYI